MWVGRKDESPSPSCQSFADSFVMLTSNVVEASGTLRSPCCAWGPGVYFSTSLMPVISVVSPRRHHGRRRPRCPLGKWVASGEGAG